MYPPLMTSDNKKIIQLQYFFMSKWSMFKKVNDSFKRGYVFIFVRNLSRRPFLCNSRCFINAVCVKASKLSWKLVNKPFIKNGWNYWSLNHSICFRCWCWSVQKMWKLCPRSTFVLTQQMSFCLFSSLFLHRYWINTK